MLLAGKRLLVTGVVTRKSIAFAVAREAQLAGAEVVLTSFGRVRQLTERAARALPELADVLELDVSSPDDLRSLAGSVRARWGGLDGVLHAIAYASPDAMAGDMLGTPVASATRSFELSAVSLKELSAALEPLMARHDGTTTSLVTLTFDSTVAWPSYNWMGVSKAALEAVARYLARDLGPRGIRVNAVAAGPLMTVAASQIPEFHTIDAEYRRRAPLGWDHADVAPVARAACFLLSDWAAGITGEVLRVDGGCHAVGCPPAVAEPPLVHASPLSREAAIAP
jgi:enoyl ACP reductase